MPGPGTVLSSSDPDPDTSSHLPHLEIGITAHSPPSVSVPLLGIFASPQHHNPTCGIFHFQETLGKPWLDC